MKSRGKHQHLLRWRSYFPIFIVFLTVLLLSYLIAPNRYLQRILLLIILWAAICSSFNIISGYGGQIVFGYMMFVGTGAYTTVLLFKFLGVTPWVGMWCGSIIAATIALIIGLPTMYLRGAYFAMATLAFPLVTVPLLNHYGLEELNIPFAGNHLSSMQFMDLRFYVLIAISLLLIILIIIQMVINSRFGFFLRALKQNETAAEGMGINTYRIKLEAFMLSAALAAAVGAVYCFGILYTLNSISVFGLFIVVRILSISILGGLGNIWGPVIGASILVPTGEFLDYQVGDHYPGVQDIVYGTALVFGIIFLPKGIWEKLRESYRYLLQTLSVSSSKRPELVEEFITSKIDGQESDRSFILKTVKPMSVECNTHDPILQVKGLYKSFGGLDVLRDLNINVPRGKILGIIGPNGAGKTTLFNIITGYLKPEKGRLFFEGKDISFAKPHVLCKIGISRTFQIPQIFKEMTVLENIMVGALSNERDDSKAYKISKDLAQEMGFKRANEEAIGLSAWEIKILELSRALATQAKLLLVDEPMAGLNLEEAKRIGEILKTIAEVGITVVVIEHVVQNLVIIADHMVGLDQGHVVAEGTPEEVTSNPRILEAYLGKKWRERFVKS